MTTLFWDVDTQYDFVNEDGKLAVPGAEEIRPALDQLTTYADMAGYTRMGSVDAHIPEDPEFADWPPHCIYGTPGQQKIPETAQADALYIPSEELLDGQVDEVVAAAADGRQVIFEKQHPDVGTNPNVDRVLNAVDPNEIVLYGVVTEVCVDAAARYLAAEQGYDVTIVEDAIMHLDPDDRDACYTAWDDIGVERTTTAELFDADGKRPRKSMGREHLETQYLLGEGDDAFLHELVDQDHITPEYAMELKQAKQQGDG